jgi:uncharacterized membrane protein
MTFTDNLWRRLGGLSLAMTLGALIGMAASLVPSLVPRGPLVQGVLSGFSMAAVAGLLALLLSVWRWLGLPLVDPGPGVRRAALALALLIVAVLLFLSAGWQDELRALMGMEPLAARGALAVALLAMGVFLLLILIARAVRSIIRRLTIWLDRFLPPRLALLLGIVSGTLLLWTLANGVLVATAVKALDTSFRELDLLIEDDLVQPRDPLKTGSPASAVAWETLGRQGRAMVTRGPTAAQIAAVAGGPVKDPIRVYVGLNSAGTPAARADLALAELIRTGAFDRKLLVIATPTGTGWIDPESQPALEYLHRGDVATVSVQYSYLASWLALLTRYDVGAETADVVFDRIYGHWRSLPPESRPRLYLHGLSLGSYWSDQSASLFKVMGDPFNGAFWVGPPYSAATWNQVTAARNPGTPFWLPRFGDGSLVRFTSQTNHLADGHAPWGPVRIVYLQYASDGITFFDPYAWWRPPAWLEGPRAPDVSPRFRWVPVVTQLQLGVDLMTSTLTPTGFGHVYAAEHYVDGWVAVTQPEGWDAAGLARLKAELRRQREEREAG